jgi:hypothetical protein
MLWVVSSSCRVMRVRRWRRCWQGRACRSGRLRLPPGCRSRPVTGLDGKTYTKPKPKPRKPKPKPEPVVVVEPEPEPVSNRKVQLPTAFRSEMKLVCLTVDLMASLTQDPRWSKAIGRFTDTDRTTLDTYIGTLHQIRTAMDVLDDSAPVDAAEVTA